MKIINHQFLNFDLLNIKVNKTPKTILIQGNFIFIIVKSYVKNETIKKMNETISLFFQKEKFRKNFDQ